jgi:hemoglobin-like flavoprotein
MTPDSIQLVQHSFRQLLPRADAIGAAFFARLTGEAPGMDRLFPAARAARRRGLIAGFAFAIETLDDFENMRPALREAGARCRALGAGAPEYERFGRALMTTLERALGADWTPRLAAAWAEVWDAVATVMQATADRARAAA